MTVREFLRIISEENFTTIHYKEIMVEYNLTLHEIKSIKWDKDGILIIKLKTETE